MDFSFVFAKKKLSILLLGLLLVSVFGGVGFVGADYQDWLSGWSYRTPVMLYNGNGTALVNYEFNFTLSRNSLVNSGKLKADMSDLVVTDSDALTPLSVWVENVYASSAIVWCKIPYVPNGVNYTIFAYYGNSLANQQFNASTVFHRVITTGVALALPMNEGSGSVCEDYSGNGNDGIVTNAAWVTTGKFGNALSFDGVNDNVDLDNNASIMFAETDFSVLAYCKSSFNGYQIIVGNKQDGTFAGYTLSQHPDNRIYSMLCDGVDLVDVRDGASALVNDGAWHSVGLSLDYGGNGIGYLDGVGQTPVNCAAVGDISGSAWNVYVGMTVNLPCYTGIIDGVFMFNRVLSVAEFSDFQLYYPQCSAANLGRLYLRGYASGITQVSLSENVLAVEVVGVSGAFVFALFYIVFLIVLSIFYGRSWLLNLVFGSFGLVFAVLSLSGYVVLGLPFHPWFEIFFALLSGITLLLPAVGRYSG